MIKEDILEEKKPKATFCVKKKIQQKNQPFIFVPELNNSIVFFP